MKRLPIDVSTFKTMIEDDYIYVDKTKHIYNLVIRGRYFFLSRPRRFGKSLLISTLAELFASNKTLFKNLWIEKESDYNWQEHPIIKLDFSALDISTSYELTRSLTSSLDKIAISYSIDISQEPSPGAKLKALVDGLAKKNKVVVLIDEYDYPLLNNLDNLKIARVHQKILRNFYSVLKSLDAYLQALFITGVTKFSKTSIFSGLNNLNDISLKPEGAALLGYTQDEIIASFEPYLQDIAHEKGKSLPVIMDELKIWYNGYRFSREDAKVYNPFSVLYYLQDKELSNYWFESGTPSFFVELIKKHYNSLENLEQSAFSYDSLGTFVFDDIALVTLLFQAGYLTIIDYDPVTRRYKLDYPNLEVRESFQKYILVTLANTNLAGIEQIAAQLINALKANDISYFCSLLQSLLANIPYQLHIPQERYYHSLFQLLSNLIGSDVQSEIVTDKGRLDLVITTKTHISIFELKFDSDARLALQQIKDKSYYERYLIKNKEIILVGLSFNHKKKKLILECASQSLATVLERNKKQ